MDVLVRQACQEVTYIALIGHPYMAVGLGLWSYSYRYVQNAIPIIMDPLVCFS